jgi:hypothetical protein
MTKTVYALFDDSIEVREALEALKAKGIPPGDITVSARDAETSRVIGAAESNTSGTETDSGVAGAGVGAAAGSVAGAALSIIPAALAAPMAIPVFVLFGMSGAMVGALTGSVAGAILGAGHQAQHLESVEQAISSGKILVAARSPEERVAELESVLAHVGGEIPHPPAA